MRACVRDRGCYTHDIKSTQSFGSTKQSRTIVAFLHFGIGNSRQANYLGFWFSNSIYGCIAEREDQKHCWKTTSQEKSFHVLVVQVKPKFLWIHHTTRGELLWRRRNVCSTLSLALSATNQYFYLVICRFILLNWISLTAIYMFWMWIALQMIKQVPYTKTLFTSNYE